MDIDVISGSNLEVNRAVPKDYAFNTNVRTVNTPDYTFNYEDGIVFFNVAYALGAVITSKFRAFELSNDAIDELIARAILEVSLDIDDTASPETNNSHRVLVLLKSHQMFLQEKVDDNVGSSIKIKQGSTSLDLTGSARTLSDQLTFITERYIHALRTFIRNIGDAALGRAIVGREEYSEDGGR